MIFAADKDKEEVHEGNRRDSKKPASQNTGRT